MCWVLHRLTQADKPDITLSWHVRVWLIMLFYSCCVSMLEQHFRRYQDFFVIFHTAVDILVGISFLHYKQWYHGTLVERHTQTFISNSYEMWS